MDTVKKERKDAPTTCHTTWTEDGLSRLAIQNPPQPMSRLIDYMLIFHRHPPNRTITRGLPPTPGGLIYWRTCSGGRTILVYGGGVRKPQDGSPERKHKTDEIKHHRAPFG